MTCYGFGKPGVSYEYSYEYSQCYEQTQVKDFQTYCLKEN